MANDELARTYSTEVFYDFEGLRKALQHKQHTSTWYDKLILVLYIGISIGVIISLLTDHTLSILVSGSLLLLCLLLTLILIISPYYRKRAFLKEQTCKKCQEKNTFTCITFSADHPTWNILRSKRQTQDQLDKIGRDSLGLGYQGMLKYKFPDCQFQVDMVYCRRCNEGMPYRVGSINPNNSIGC